MGIPRLTFQEFLKLCSVYHSLYDEDRGDKESLVKALAKDARPLASKIAELTGAQMLQLRGHIMKYLAGRKKGRTT